MHSCVFSFEECEYRELDCYLSLSVPLISAQDFYILIIDIVAVMLCLSFLRPSD